MAVWAVALIAAAASLDVPFLPQTDRLCGGASLAMVFRYWGDTHANVHEFAPLVDPLAGGIATRVMVEEARRRGWTALPTVGSIERLGNAIRQGHPAIVLLQDRPHRYHFVVVVGADQEQVVIHDPAWGPSRGIPIRQFNEAWAPTGNWSLVILPPSGHKREQPDVIVPSIGTAASDRCERLVSETIVDSGSGPLLGIESRLLSIRQQCESSPAPLRELAGVRFAQHRWRDAERLAEQAIALQDDGSYTSDLLASSRYLQGDLEGALAAWSRIDKPRVDLVNIEGLHRTRYPVLIEGLRLPINDVLRPDDFRAAQRRLAEWPGLNGTRIGFTPVGDGYATVDVAVTEKSAVPGNRSEWLSASASAAVNREVRIEIPGTTGQAEVWSANWRWWAHRPAVSFEFLAPRAGRVPGLWRVGGGWETESYDVTSLEGTAVNTEQHSRVRGELSVSNWIMPDLRYSMTLGLASWDGNRRAALVAASLDRRFVRDRLAIEADAARWIPVASGAPFQTGRVRVRAQSSAQPTRWRALGEIGLDAASENAPLTEWVGAGDGHAREALLRAHPLLQDGVISGSTFGRYLTHANGEVQRWFEGPTPVRMGIAMFVDLAESSRRLQPSSASAFQIDVGIGARIRTPGPKGALRVDLGQGLRDRHWALTLGWQR